MLNHVLLITMYGSKLIFDSEAALCDFEMM